MVTALLATVLLGQAIGPAVRHRVGPLSFELPASWRQTSRNKDTVQFDAATGDAYLLIDVNRVQTPDLTPEACLDIVLERLAAGPTWKRKTLDVFAVAHQINFDRSPNLANTARVEQIVGCDGRFAWSMVFFIDIANWSYFAQVTKHAVESLRRSKARPEARAVETLEDDTRESQGNP